MQKESLGTYLIDDNLNRFDEAIFAKGEEIFKQGRVEITYADTLSGEFHFNVRGHQKYAVRMDFLGHKIKKMHCSCPYFAVGNCKHLAASLLAIEANFGRKEEIKSKEEIAKKIFPTLSRAYVNVAERYVRFGIEEIRKIKPSGEDAFYLIRELLKCCPSPNNSTYEELLDGYERLGLKGRHELVILSLSILPSSKFYEELSKRGYNCSLLLEKEAKKNESPLLNSFAFALPSFFEGLSQKERNLLLSSSSLDKYVNALLPISLDKKDEGLKDIDLSSLAMSKELFASLASYYLSNEDRAKANLACLKAINAGEMDLSLFKLSLEANVPISLLIETMKKDNKEKAPLFYLGELPYSSSLLSSFNVEEIDFVKERLINEEGVIPIIRSKIERCLLKKSLKEEEYVNCLNLIAYFPALKEMAKTSLVKELSKIGGKARRAYLKTFTYFYDDPSEAIRRIA